MSKKDKTVARASARLYIPRAVYEEMLFVARLAEPNEVQMLGEVSESEDMDFTVEDVFLIKQTVTGSGATFDDDAMALFVGNHPHPEKIWFWMHSHVRMGNFWSTTDLETMHRLLAGMDKLLSVVMCVDGTCLGRFDLNLGSVKDRIRKMKFADAGVRRDLFRILFLPERVHWDKVDVEIESYLSSEVRDTLTAEVEEKVNVTAPTVRIIRADGQPVHPMTGPDLRQGVLITGSESATDVACCKNCELLKVSFKKDVILCCCTHPENNGKVIENVEKSCEHYLPRTSRDLHGSKSASCATCANFTTEEGGMGDTGVCYKTDEAERVHVNDVCEEYIAEEMAEN